MADIQQHARSSKVDKTTFEQLTKYVRVRSSEAARFVEFDFAISDPCLFVELIMPKTAFKQFCQTNNVVFMTQEQEDAVDADIKKWRYGKETLMAKNHYEQHVQAKNIEMLIKQ